MKRRYDDNIQEAKQNQRLEAIETKFNLLKKVLEKKLETISTTLKIILSVNKPEIDEYEIYQKSDSSIFYASNRIHETNQNYKINLMKAQIQYLAELSNTINNILKEIFFLELNSLSATLSYSGTDISQFIQDHSRQDLFLGYKQNGQNVEISKIENFLRSIENNLKDINLQLNIKLDKTISESILENNNDIQDISYLLGCGALPSPHTVELAFAKNNDYLLDIIINLMDIKDLNIPLSDNKTLFLKLVETNKIKLVETLAIKGVDLNPVFGNYQYTSLYLLSLIYKIGTTPLSYAVENNYHDIASLLYKSGAQIDIVDNKGHTVRELIGEGTEKATIIYGFNIPKKNFFTIVPNIISKEFGYFIGKFLITPAIDCANFDKYYRNYNSKHYINYQSKETQKYNFFTECYVDQFDSNHVLDSIKIPAITSVLYYLNPTIILAIKPAINLFNDYSKGTYFQDLVISLISSAMLYPVIEKDPIFKHYPVTYGIALSIFDHLLGYITDSD